MIHRPKLYRNYLILLLLLLNQTFTFANDNCGSAKPITQTGSIDFGTNGAGIDPEGGICNGSRANTRGRWFYFIGKGATVRLSTCIGNTAFDTWMGVYTGSCGNLTCVDSNDDSSDRCSIDKASDLSIFAQDKVTYYVLIGGYRNLTGTVTLGVFCTGGGSACIYADQCPTDPNKILAGVCGCNVPDVDTDLDGVLDCNDNCPTDRNKVEPGVCGCNHPDEDTDKDGKLNCEDQCPNNPAKTHPGVCGCDVLDIDSDRDGIFDCVDDCDNRIDSDQDGLEDCIDNCDDRIDTDNDGTSDCKDECPRDPLKVIKDACGCGEPPQIDSDGDGIVNCLDPCPYNLEDYLDGILACGIPIIGSTFRGDRIIDNYGSCTSDQFQGRELFYKHTLYQPGNFTIELKKFSNNTRSLTAHILNDVCTVESCIGTLVAYKNNAAKMDFENMPAGDYYVVIDEFKTYDRSNFELSVICNNGDGALACEGDAINSEDFEGFQADADIVEISENWEYFGESSSSAFVKEFEENKVLYLKQFTGAADINYLLNGASRGVMKVSWEMFIEKNYTAYFNLFGHPSTVDYGVGYRFKTDNNHLQNRWIKVEVIVDLDNYKYLFYLDNRAQVFEGNYPINFTRINFYAGLNGRFYVDNLCYSMVDDLTLLDRSADEISTTLRNANQSSQKPIFTNEVNNPKKHLNPSVVAFPNPTEGKVTFEIDLPEPSELKLEIYNLKGQLVKQYRIAEEKAARPTLDFSSLPKGIYLTRIIGKDLLVNKKIMVR